MVVKVALFGSSGLLGSAVSSALGKRGHSYIPYSNQVSVKNSKKICLSDSEQLTRQLLDEWPDAIINCAAISSPDAVTQNPEFARAINVDGAIRLAEIASHLGARYLHISTDMVFDGSSSPYRSTDIPNPLGEYGIQKLDAEKGVLAVAESALDYVKLVPNPYFSISLYENSQLDNIVKITNLPESCTINIYTVEGALVKTFKKDNTLTWLPWDLTNNYNVPIASGAYLIHINAPGVGERVIKWFGTLRPFDPTGF